MNIEGIGPETIDTLYSKKLISNYADLYSLHFEQLIDLERMAEKSANNILFGLRESKKIPFERVLFALGIRHVGETVAKKLAKHFKSLENIQKASFEELVAVDEIGDKIAMSIQQFFLNERNLEIIKSLAQFGLMLETEEIANESELLVEKTFVISGVFEKVSRTELADLIEKNGGKNTSSISAKTNYLIAGQNMGPAKLAKAEKLGVKIISETDFLKMIGR